MKFHYKLDYFENMKLRRSARLDARHAYTDLSNDAQCWLRRLNERLKALEDQYVVIMRSKYAELNARLADPPDWLSDFEYELVISFYLQEGDWEYDEDDENILMQICVRGHHRLEDTDDWGFGHTHVDHAESCTHFEGESHCYLYHELYDHCDLDWIDLLRIGEIFVELKIVEQSAVMPLDTFQGNSLREGALP